jgi:hypothetical protein
MRSLNERIGRFRGQEQKLAAGSDQSAPEAESVGQSLVVGEDFWRLATASFSR